MLLGNVNINVYDTWPMLLSKARALAVYLKVERAACVAGVLASRVSSFPGI